MAKSKQDMSSHAAGYNGESRSHSQPSNSPGPCSNSYNSFQRPSGLLYSSSESESSLDSAVGVGACVTF